MDSFKIEQSKVGRINRQQSEQQQFIHQWCSLSQFINIFYQMSSTKVGQFQTWRSANTILKMPSSPFLKPMQSKILHQSVEYMRGDHPKNNVKHKAKGQPQSIEILMTEKVNETLMSRPFKVPQKQMRIKKKYIKSKIKTILRITRKIESTKNCINQQRKYEVQCRYGNQALTFTQQMKENQILKSDPQLLIELLLKARKCAMKKGKNDQQSIERLKVIVPTPMKQTN